MSALAGRYAEHVKKRPKRVSPLQDFRRLLDPVPGEDRVARFARVSAAKQLGFLVNHEDFEFVRSIHQLVNAEAARARCVQSFRNAAYHRKQNCFGVSVFKINPA